MAGTTTDQFKDMEMNGNGANVIRNLKCMKYSLMVINSFGVLLGFFIVLFGLAYPEENFPGGYTGKETAMFAGIFIFFSVFGYCGASQQKNLFLIPYVVAIFFGMMYNFFNWATHEGQGCLDPKSLSLSGILILLLALALVSVLNIRKSTEVPPESKPGC